MTLQQRYQLAKRKLLSNVTICAENRCLFGQFFEWEEYKLKRINGLRELDEKSYKTLLDYVSRLQTVNRWFDNKPWERLAREDIKSVYDAVEDGQIVTRSGRPFKRAGTYFRKILRGKPFDLAGKRELVREIMVFHAPRDSGDVRFIRESSFRELVEVAIKPEHKTLLWLAWDIGENISSLLLLRKRDLRRETNPDTQESEYYVTLRRETLKRSRTPRTEITNYSDTVRFLDRVLENMPDDAQVFEFGHRMAAKMLARAVRIMKVTCIPNGESVTLKDLRSSMACDLLSKGWTTDEVNRRLGHKPSSREIDKYVNWLALDQQRPKRKLHDNQVDLLKKELDTKRDQETLSQQRLRSLQEQIEELRQQLERNNRMMYEQVVRLIRQERVEESIVA